MFRQMDIYHIKKADYHRSEKQNKRRKDIRREKLKSADAFKNYGFPYTGWPKKTKSESKFEFLISQ